MPAQNAGPLADNTTRRVDASAAARATAAVSWLTRARERAFRLAGRSSVIVNKSIGDFDFDERFDHKRANHRCLVKRQLSRISGGGMRISSRASASVLPWLSVRSERLAPPPKTFFNTKL